MKDFSRIIYLFKREINNTITSSELEELLLWAKESADNQKLFDHLMERNNLLGDIRLYQELWNEEETNDRTKRILATVKSSVQPSSLKLRPWLLYAAAVLVIGFVAVYWNSSRNLMEQSPLVSQEDVLPGGNRAILKLSGNRVVRLNEDQSGITMGAHITYLDGTAIIENSNVPETITLETPSGGNYQVVLPDGSKVWLNANSSISYPSVFPSNEREVQLNGEAYFEIKSKLANGRKIPFTVKTKEQLIWVTGTEFNVNAYAEGEHTKTTLIQGAVTVENTRSKYRKVISPTEQAINNGNGINVAPVEINNVLAWKKGQFSFDNKSFEEIIKEMARWYNLKVEYIGGIPNDRFMGNAYKTDKLKTVLNFLENSTIGYQIRTYKTGQTKLIIKNKSSERRKEK